MTGLAATPVLLRARWAAGRRRLAAAAFPYLVLAPILLGAATWVGGRYVELARDRLRDAIAGAPATALLLASLVALAALVPSARRELLGLEPAHGFLAAQPVPPPARLAVALTAVAARAVALAVGVAVVLLATSAVPPTAVDVAATLLRCLAVLLATAPCAVAAAAASIRLAPTARPTRRRRPLSAERSGARSPIAALVRRDLRLVARRATPAVPLAVATAALLVAAAVVRLPEAGLPALWTLRLGVLAGVLAALALAAIVPFLVAREVPRLWLERTTAVGWDTLVRARVATATVLGLAGAAAGAGALALGPGLRAGLPAAAIVAGVLELLLAATLASATLGAAAWELPTRPLLGLLFATLAGLAPAALIVFVPGAWWLWSGLGGYLVATLVGRAPRRLRRLELLETGR